jgi:hypothetical protein
MTKARRLRILFPTLARPLVLPFFFASFAVPLKCLYENGWLGPGDTVIDYTPLPSRSNAQCWQKSGYMSVSKFDQVQIRCICSWANDSGQLLLLPISMESWLPDPLPVAQTRPKEVPSSDLILTSSCSLEQILRRLGLYQLPQVPP